MSKSSRAERFTSEETVVGERSTEASHSSYDILSPSKPFAHETQSSKYYLAVSVSAITFLVYLKSLQNMFVNWDDPKYVLENPYIQSLNQAFFRWAFFDFYASNWHPLTWISHALDRSIWGLDPMGHHLTNIILHSANTFIVVLLIIRLIYVWKGTTAKHAQSVFRKDQAILVAGGAAGLLFGLHPLHVESVAWIAERKDLLCALFFLLSIMLYTKYRQGSDNETIQKTLLFHNKHYILALSFFALALLSKPMAVTLPFVLLILDWYPYQRVNSLKSLRSAFVEKLPFVALSLISSVLTILAQKAGGAMTMMELVPLSTRLPVAAAAIMAYIWKMMLPLQLNPYYPYPQDVSFLSVVYLLSIFLVIVITAACIILAKKQRLWLCCWSYYLTTLLPVLGIVQVGAQSMADRYTYLPSLGPFFIAGLITAAIYEKAVIIKRGRVALKMVSIVAAVGVLIFMTYATIRQIGIWENSITLWNYVIKKEPSRLPFVHYNLGNAYKSTGLLDMAIAQYVITINLKPDFAEVRNNLGNAYMSKGLLDMAMAQYIAAISLKPELAEARNSLGNAYMSKGLLDMATAQYIAAISLKPELAEAHYNLGNIYLEKGDINLARREFELALKIRPNYSAAKQSLDYMISR